MQTGGRVSWSIDRTYQRYHGGTIFIVTAWNDTGESEPTVEGSATPEAPSVVYALGDAPAPPEARVIHDNPNSYTDGWRYLEAAPSELDGILSMGGGNR